MEFIEVELELEAYAWKGGIFGEKAKICEYNRPGSPCSRADRHMAAYHRNYDTSDIKSAVFP